MPRRVPLPRELIRAPFATSDAAAAGLGDGRLRGRDLEHPFRGVYSTSVAQSVLERCREFVPLLRRGDYFSHTTAARLWNCPLAREFDPSEPLHISSLPPLTPVRRKGVEGHRSTAGSYLSRAGLPVSTAPATWLALGGMLPRDELVAVGDHLILDPRVLDPLDLRPYTTLALLTRALRDFHGRGAAAAASALPLIRQGAESRPETLLRLLLASAGFPEPELQREIRRGRSSLGFVDLLYSEYRVVVEYDGDGHRTSAWQYDRDITRIDDIIALGYTVVRVRKRGLFVTPHTTIERVENALRAHGWSPKARKPR